MNLSKRIATGLIVLSMGLGFVPQIIYATETTANSLQDDASLQYEVSQEINSGKTQSTISLKLSNADYMQLEKVTLPDGTQFTTDFSTVTYVATVNGQYEFKVDYFTNGENQSVTIPVQVTELNTLQSEPMQENSLLQYEVAQEANEEKTQTTISLQIAQPETIQLLKVILPDGTEQTEDFSNVTYTASKNGPCDFTVVYLMDGIEQNEIIPVEVTELVDQAQVVADDELNASIELKGATFFDGTPWTGTTQTILKHNKDVPYNGWQLMQLTIEIPYQDGLDVKVITPSVVSEYPDLSKIEKDDKKSLWTYDFYFYDNGTYEFTIDYTLNGKNKTTTTSFIVDGLVSIKDAAMRRHLINEYGEFSGLSYQGGQYVTKDILAKPQYDPWGNLVFDFGKDGDNGSTAKYTTSLDGLQYLTNIHGMYLYDCSHLASGETIEPITNTYYPNMKLFRLTNITDSSNALPEGSYTPEMISAAIANMPNLYELSISGTGFKDLPVIGQLNGQLGYLEADYCAIESVAGIEKHPNLTSISLGINQIQSLQPLENANLSQVKFMDLGGNQIFDLRPLNATLNSNIVGGQRFGALRQTIQYEKTVIANLNGDQYEIELPMPIDIDGSLTDADQAAVGFPDGTQKNYTPIKKEGKTYLSIPKADVDSTAENPFKDMKFAFTFNNKNGVDTRTKNGFSGTVYFRVSPFATKYGVVYDYISGTAGQPLPKEVTDLLPIDPSQYEEGQTINAIQPQQTTVTVEGGTWTFEGYDANSKLANDANANENGDIPFTGTWTFTKTEPPVTKKYQVDYDFISGSTDQELPQEVVALLPVDSNQYDEGQTINAIQPTSTTVTVADGVWTFEGYDAQSKIAADDQVSQQDGLIHFTGTWTFTKTQPPVTKKYQVDYDFISGSTDQELPQEVLALLPSDPNQYDEGQTVNAIQPQQTTVTVADGTWTFNGYDSNSKIANADQANENGVITFTGAWTFEKSGNPDPENPGPGPDRPDPDPDKPTHPDKPTDPNKPVDPNKPTDPNKPAEPSNPSNPNQPSNPGSNKPGKPDQNKPTQSDSVGTATRTNLLFSSVLLLISGISMLGVVGLKMRKYNDEIR